jgi:hypothetical protein
MVAVVELFVSDFRGERRDSFEDFVELEIL